MCLERRQVDPKVSVTLRDGKVTRQSPEAELHEWSWISGLEHRPFALADCKRSYWTIQNTENENCRSEYPTNEGYRLVAWGKTERDSRGCGDVEQAITWSLSGLPSERMKQTSHSFLVTSGTLWLAVIMAGCFPHDVAESPCGMSYWGLE